MTRSLLTAATLFTAGMCVVGCRKTEVVAAPPERAITPAPQPVIIEHDRPAVVEHDRVIERDRPAYGNTIIERRSDGTVIERRPDGSEIERRPDGTVIERPR